MKRLVFCFDGTWNKLVPELATNVVLTAASIQRMDDDGIPQIIHYDEGVGTGSLDAMRGGMFGQGLIQNVREAYRFLVFNYDPGDEIYVFGFSRGAYSARTFIGFIRHVGPLHRLHVGRIDEALKLYEESADATSDALRQFRATYSDKVCIGQADDDWRCQNLSNYEGGSSPQMRIQYLGVWDTVGALGVPELIPFSGWLNRRHDFHDASLDSFVENARHAVAIDEKRELFPPETFGDLTKLNGAKGFENEDTRAPYQERWFPGVHGSVGGGGDIRGLSDSSLTWVLSGAKKAGLKLDTERGTRIHGIRPDPFAQLINEKNPEWSATQLLSDDRDGPDQIWQLSNSALRRWRTPAEKLDDKNYRPGSLSKLKPVLDKLGPWQFSAPTDLITTEKVKVGDTLSKYARRHYGDAEKWPTIFEANADTIENPDDIFPGQLVRVPKLLT
ncbi:peptigoglycan-binding protein LysM [Sphingomonadales bacterium EhC05]|nr:peptigoglycan-binding protein LysM [Sphingomonadales bacterium EhC05]